MVAQRRPGAAQPPAAGAFAAPRSPSSSRQGVSTSVSTVAKARPPATAVASWSTAGSTARRR